MLIYMHNLSKFIDQSLPIFSPLNFWSFNILLSFFLLFLFCYFAFDIPFWYFLYLIINLLQLLPNSYKQTPDDKVKKSMVGAVRSIVEETLRAGADEELEPDSKKNDRWIQYA